MPVIVLTQTGTPTTAMQASFSGTQMNVVSLTGTLVVGAFLYGTSIPSNTYILSFASGTGGTGTYNINRSLSIAQEAVTTLYGWQVPGNWTNSNTVETIGAGGGAGVHDDGGLNGAGGGAYSLTNNVALVAGVYAPYFIGAGGTAGTNTGGAGTDGGDTWFNGGTLAGASVGAQHGQGGYSGGALGGQASAGVGTTKYNGGNGAAGSSSPPAAAASGGGAAGPNGHGGNGNWTTSGAGGGSGGGGSGGGGSGTGGANGSAGTPGSTGGAGGNNSAGTGGAAGGSPGNGTAGTVGGGGSGAGTQNTIETSGGAGGPGADWTATAGGTYGAGGGGGSAGSRGNGGNGGLYGGGGGCGNDTVIGASRSGGTGGQGIIVITYSTAPVNYPAVAAWHGSGAFSLTGNANNTGVALFHGSGTLAFGARSTGAPPAHFGGRGGFAARGAWLGGVGIPFHRESAWTIMLYGQTVLACEYDPTTHNMRVYFTGTQGQFITLLNLPITTTNAIQFARNPEAVILALMQSQGWT